MRLLLVEDDARLAHAVRSWMGHEQIEVTWVTQGRDVLPTLHRQDHDWVVLDLGLPDQPGDQALADLRSAGYELPVVVMTAREKVQDRVRLLDLGADDFLVKPVHLDELAARLRALRRRQAGHSGPRGMLRHDKVCLMPASRTVSVDGQYVPLTNREFWLLEALMRHKGQVLSREQLQESLHGWSDDAVGNAVDVHVHHLRRKLGAACIRTVRGRGYMLGPEG